MSEEIDRYGNPKAVFSNAASSVRESSAAATGSTKTAANSAIRPVSLFRPAGDDVVGCPFDPFLAIGQPAEGLDQFWLACLFSVIGQEL